MLIECRGDSKLTTIAVGGEIDHHGAKEAMMEIGRIINSKMPMNLELDFSAVSFMDSSGIAIIVTTLRRVKEYGGRLRLVNVPEQAYKVILTTGLDKLIEVKCAQMR